MKTEKGPVGASVKEAPNRRQLWKGLALSILGLLGIAFSCFIRGEFAVGEAGRMHYHNGTVPPMTFGDTLGLAAVWTLLGFPSCLGLLLGVPLFLVGLKRCLDAIIAMKDALTQ